MSDPTDITAKLADVQKRLLDLPDDAFAEKFDLLKERDAQGGGCELFRDTRQEPK